MADKPNLGYAVVFCVLYIIGILFFALRPALDGGSWLTALGCGAALGAFAYATYDLTNAATLKDWPLVIVLADILRGCRADGPGHGGGLADILRGAVLTGLATVAGWLVFH